MPRIIVFSFCLIGFLSLSISGIFAQPVNGESSTRAAKSSTTKLDPSRIEDANYRLLMFNEDKGSLSNLTVVERNVSRQNYDSRPCIRIMEIDASSNPKTKTVVFIDARSLRPIYFEMYKGDALVQKATFETSKIHLVDIDSGSEKITESTLSPDTYLSNSFSELVQANNFTKNPTVRFTTVSPGKTENRFLVERIGDKNFVLPDGHEIGCWILKFTKTDSQGVENPGGYRYVDKNSGKVVMFKSAIDSDSFFSYQVIL